MVPGTGLPLFILDSRFRVLGFEPSEPAEFRVGREEAPDAGRGGSRCFVYKVLAQLQNGEVAR